MSITKFTPVPWELEIVPGEVRIYAADDCCIADLSPDFDNLEDEAEIAANGRLLVCAPDLYTVLDAFLSDIDEHGEVGFTIRQRARALLNKVEGLTP